MIYTIWGSPGSGKSMLACLLARRLSQDGEKTIVINDNADCPMLPVWLPSQPARIGASLGEALAAKEIDKALVADHVVIHKRFLDIGFLGFGPEDNATSFAPYSTSALTSVVRAATELVSRVILDCTGGARNKFTATAMQAADVLVQVSTPDHKGMSFLRAQQPALSNMRLSRGMQVKFAGMARPFHDFDTAGDVAGSFDGILPYGKDMERVAADAGFCASYDVMNTRYTDAIEYLVEVTLIGTDQR